MSIDSHFPSGAGRPPRLSRQLALWSAVLALLITAAIVLTSGLTASQTLEGQIGRSLAELAEQSTR
ncbi:MAG: hypothetical protein M3N23_06065, partial [Pseudomonadota bacterium]|nr:hypothetical protein [Pseudomonadota bacterium]